jgi:AcrR family transcriptional regulator
MNGFERRKEQKKDAIRHAAAFLFLENGPEKVTMKEIAERANVSHVTIFKYFNSKQDLIQEVIRWCFEQEYKQLEDVLKGEQPYLVRLKEMMSFKRKVFDPANVDLYNVANASDPGRLDDTMSYFQDKKSKLYHEFFQEGKDKCFIRQDASIDALITLIEGFRALVKVKPELLAEMKYHKTLLEDCIKVLLFGIMGKQERNQVFDQL